jgi:hypothetical protein
LAVNLPQQVAGSALLARVTHRPERDRRRLRGAAPPHRVALGNPAGDRESASERWWRCSARSRIRAISGAGGVYKDPTVPARPGDRILDAAVHGKGLAANATGADLELIEVVDI